MPESILRYRDLVGIVIDENGEPLICAQDGAPEVIWEYEKQDMVPLLGDRMLLRQGVVERVRSAALWLARHLPDAQMRVVYAYRHPDIQERYFSARLEGFRKRFPELTEIELRELAHTQSAAPDVAGHPTGGAVDLTIMHGSESLDMGTAIADFSLESEERIKTFCSDITESQRINRALLRSVMMHAGFAPYNGEWWHFSYGDREWAAYYGHPHAIYNQIRT